MSSVSKRPAGADLDRGLAVEITRRDLLADFLRLGRHAGPGAVEHQAAGASRAGVLGGRRADAEDRRQQDAARQLTPVIVDPVLQAGGAG